MSRSAAPKLLVALAFIIAALAAACGDDPPPLRYPDGALIKGDGGSGGPDKATPADKGAPVDRSAPDRARPDESSPDRKPPVDVGPLPGLGEPCTDRCRPPGVCRKASDKLAYCTVQCIHDEECKKQKAFASGCCSRLPQQSSPGVCLKAAECKQKPCASDGECGDGKICLNGRCVAPLCKTSGDCKKDETCVNGRCVLRTRCRSHEECPAGYICTDTGACTPGCRRDTDCKKGERCVGGKCVVPRCNSSQDCPAGQTCQSGVCKPAVKLPGPGQACSADGRCAAPAICVQGGRGQRFCTIGCSTMTDCSKYGSFKGGCCQSSSGGPAFCLPAQYCQTPPCKSDRDCPSGQVCNAKTGTCGAPGCKTDVDCPSGQACVKGVCQQVTPLPGPGKNCTADGKCQPPAFCVKAQNGSFCTVGCQVDTDCQGIAEFKGGCCVSAGGTSRVCVPSQYCGTPGRCQTANDCQPGQQCINGVCTTPSKCRSDADCKKGLTCVKGVCTTSLPGPGKTCVRAQGCQAPAICVGDQSGNNFCSLICKTQNDCQHVAEFKGGCCLQAGGNTYVCAPSRYCGSSGNCSGDRDCPAGQRCVNGRCTTALPGPGVACLNGKCASGAMCVKTSDGQQLCTIGCSTDANCTRIPTFSGGCCLKLSGAAYCMLQRYCSSSGRLCATHANCPSGQQCIRGRCTPGACLSDTDCPVGESCSNGRCGSGPAPCRTNADCPTGQMCQSGRCVNGTPPCRSNAECPRGQVCQSGQCVAGGRPCQSARDCGPNQQCVNGRCM